MANNRVWYGTHSVSIAECGTNSFTAVHGLQSLSTNLRLNLEPYFEVGQAAIYELKEQLPDVEATLEKVLDGYPPAYMLATKGATSATLAGRSNRRCTLGVAFFTDTQDSASGTPLARCVMSGMYVSQIEYSFQVNGAFTESLSLVGNNRVWDNAFTIPTFNNADAPMAITGSGGVNIRQHFLLGEDATTRSKFPTVINGVSASGYVPYSTVTQSYAVPIQSVRISTSLGREPLLELGKRGPYHRYAQFPVEVRADVEVLSLQGDAVVALEDDETNTSETSMNIVISEGLRIDLGNKIRLSGVTQGGGNAGQNGGNVTNSYSFLTYSTMTVTHPQDPSGL